jgi:acyl-CoA reductase-like NAD-dependent aldehyde dehydrogenase
MPTLEAHATRTPVSHAALVLDRAERLRRLGSGAAHDSERVIAALCAAAKQLLDADNALGRALRRDLPKTTGLHPTMIDWGLCTSLNTLQPNVLRALLHAQHSSTRCLAVPHKLVAVVLAGNLFSSAVRALFLPLLAGANVIAKAASADDVLPRALKRALDNADAEVGQRLQVVSFGRDDDAATQALLAQANAVSAYGDDATLQMLARGARPESHFIAHGHGMSAAYISRAQLTDATRARDAADRLALDIAAYDQRGCLSPQVAFVERGGAVDPRAFAELLARASLPLLAELLPPGKPDTAARAAQLQWEAVAAARGELYRGASHAVSFERCLAARPSPGGRLISVYACEGVGALRAALAGFGAHLKCVGVAGPAATRAQVAESLRGLAAATVCRLGDMQTPPFDAYADGQPPLEGLFTFVDVR